MPRVKPEGFHGFRRFLPGRFNRDPGRKHGGQPGGVRGCKKSRIQDRKQSLVALLADEPAETLLERQNGSRDLELIENPSSRPHFPHIGNGFQQPLDLGLDVRLHEGIVGIVEGELDYDKAP